MREMPMARSVCRVSSDILERVSIAEERRKEAIAHGADRREG